MKSIFLDYNSTTPVDKHVLDAMLPYFSGVFGNAASKTHSFGWAAAEAVKLAREQVAKFIGAGESEIVFTSGATESINLAIKGVAESYNTIGRHIVVAATEHKAVLDSCQHLSRNGYEITKLSVLPDGLIDASQLKDMIRKDTILVCIMLANNETGVIQDTMRMSEIVHQQGALLFVDATQACGKIAVDVNECGADLLCLSAHKMYGPKGTGALYIRRKNPRVRITSQMDGGGHENNLRSGTQNVAGIVGLGHACSLSEEVRWNEAAHMSLLRTKLEQAFLAGGKVSINGNAKNRLPNTSNLCFHHLKAERLITQVPFVAVATGSACTSALPEASHVLKAMGLSEQDAHSSLRFSLGRFTTEEEIDIVIDAYGKAISV